MFKHFGFKETAFSVKRFFVLIVVLTLLFALVGYYFGKSYIENFEPKYAVSQSYFITSSVVIETAQKSNQADIDCADSLAGMLKADFCRQFVFDEVLKKFSNEQIADACDISDSAKVYHAALSKVINANVITNTSMLNVYSVSKNADFSAAVTAACEKYLTEKAGETLPYLETMKPLGGTTVVTDQSGMSPDKYAVVAGALGLVLSVCIIALLALIDPTVTDQASFEDYSEYVFCSDIKDKQKRTPYICDQVIDRANKTGVKNIGVMCTVSGKSSQRKRDEFVKELNAAAPEDMTFTAVGDITRDFGVYKSLADFDAVIMCERKGKTRHKKIAENLSLMAKKQINLIGIAVV